MLGNLLEPEIREMIAAKDFAGVRELFAEGWEVPDIAELISELSAEEQVLVFRLLPQSLATDVFEYLEIDAQKHLLHAMGQEETVRLINEMSADDRTALFEELPGTVVTQLLRLLSPEERAVAQTLLNYPEESVGRLMTPEFIAVKESSTVQQVLDYVREHGEDSETLNVIYVTDERDRLIDDIRIREFLLRPLDARVADIRDKSFVALHVTDDKSAAVDAFKKYDRNTLPVVNSDERLMGIVTVDDVIDVIEEEATEDIQKMGGTEALDEPYLDTPLLAMIRKRAGWLSVLFVGEMLTASAMQVFEDQIAKAVMLAMFVPLIISSGGNSGSQASTLIIRAMSLGEVSFGDWWRVMRKEIFSGLVLGAILGALGFTRIAVWSAFSNVYGPHALLVGCTVGIALVGVVLWGTLAGSMLPLILGRCGADPAASSGPFVATLVDVTGLLIYFSVALVVLKGTVL
jgi:magnesium transporter